MLNTQICTPQYLAVTEKSYTFAPLLDQEPVSNRRRDGRVVDYNGLENRRAERHRGFESLSLRKVSVTSRKTTSCADFSFKGAPNLRQNFSGN